MSTGSLEIIINQNLESSSRDQHRILIRSKQFRYNAKKKQPSNNPCTGLESKSVDQDLVPLREENPTNKKRK